MAKLSRNQWIALIITVLVMINVALIFTMILNTKRLRDEYKVSKTWHCKKDVKEFIRNELNLTNDQFAFFETERQRHFSEKKPVQAQMDTLRNLIRAEVFKPVPDTMLIKHMADSIGLLQANLELMVVLHFNHLTQQLNPEQKVAFEKLLKKQQHRERRNKGEHKHTPNRPQNELKE